MPPTTGSKSGVDQTDLLTRRRPGFLGAQVTGTKGVDKRIDVLATASKDTDSQLNDLADLELAYAPPLRQC
jgi:hypothetical protein